MTMREDKPNKSIETLDRLGQIGRTIQDAMLRYRLDFDELKKKGNEPVALVTIYMAKAYADGCCVALNLKADELMEGYFNDEDLDKYDCR